MLQKGNYLKLETRYVVKTVFRNGIYDKFCIRMGVFWRKPLFFHRPSTLSWETFTFLFIFNFRQKDDSIISKIYISVVI